VMPPLSVFAVRLWVAGTVELQTVVDALKVSVPTLSPASKPAANPSVPLKVSPGRIAIGELTLNGAPAVPVSIAATSPVFAMRKV